MSHRHRRKIIKWPLIFWGQWKADKAPRGTTRRYIIMLAFLQVPKIYTATESTENWCFWQPYCLTSYLQGTPRISVQTIYCHKLQWLSYIFAVECGSVYLHSNFRGRAPKNVWPFKVIQGRWFWAFLAPIESAYATSCQWSIVASLNLVPSCTVSDIQLMVFCRKQPPHPNFTRNLGCSPWTRLSILGLRSAKTG